MKGGAQERVGFAVKERKDRENLPMPLCSVCAQRDMPGAQLFSLGGPLRAAGGGEIGG